MHLLFSTYPVEPQSRSLSDAISGDRASRDRPTSRSAGFDRATADWPA